MYLTDLAFIEEGTPNYTEDGLVNFSKMRMVSVPALLRACGGWLEVMWLSAAVLAGFCASCAAPAVHHPPNPSCTHPPARRYQPGLPLARNVCGKNKKTLHMVLWWEVGME